MGATCGTGAPESLPTPPQQLPKVPPLLSKEPLRLVLQPRLLCIRLSALNLHVTTPQVTCAEAERHLLLSGVRWSQNHHQELQAYANATSGSQRASVGPATPPRLRGTGPWPSLVRSLIVSECLSPGLCWLSAALMWLPQEGPELPDAGQCQPGGAPFRQAGPSTA